MFLKRFFNKWRTGARVQRAKRQQRQWRAKYQKKQYQKKQIHKAFKGRKGYYKHNRQYRTYK